jgi:ribosomal protein S27E
MFDYDTLTIKPQGLHNVGNSEKVKTTTIPTATGIIGDDQKVLVLCVDCLNIQPMLAISLGAQNCISCNTLLTAPGKP